MTMALVPRGSTEIVPYADGLSWPQRRRIEGKILEDDLNEARHARHYQKRQRNANQLIRDTFGMDETLDAELQEALDAKPGPRLEDMADERWEQWRRISGGIIKEAYGNG